MAATTLAVAFVACAVGDVRAANYNHSCTKDDDCEVVFEVVANGGKCTLPCGSINKSDDDKYQTDSVNELNDCSSVASGECKGAPLCKSGTCAIAPPKDAGAD
jgi:hypothetical protein